MRLEKKNGWSASNSHLTGGRRKIITPNSHGLDAVERLFARRYLIVMVTMWQAELVEDFQLAPRVFNGLEARHGDNPVIYMASKMPLIKPGLGGMGLLYDAKCYSLYEEGEEAATEVIS